MRTLIKILTGLLVVVVVVIAWGLIEPYFIDVERHEAVVPGLPESWEGERIAVIADLQVGMWLDNTATIERVVDRLIREDPAAVLIAGDFVYDARENITPEVEEVAGLLAPLTDAGVPTYAVLGNHDYGMPTRESPSDTDLAAAVTSALEAIGIHVLHNEARVLPPSDTAEGEALHVVGIGPHLPGEDDVAAALADVPEAAARIVLLHHPNTFASLPAGTAPLALAGHTHGGQMRIPFTPQRTWMSYVEGDEVHSDGWIRGYGRGDNRLYVNRGIGFSVVPMRLNCPPEMTLLTLRAS